MEAMATPLSALSLFLLWWKNGDGDATPTYQIFDISKYASMRMQTQGSRRLSSEATTLLIFQPYHSHLCIIRINLLLVAWKTSFCYLLHKLPDAVDFTISIQNLMIWLEVGAPALQYKIQLLITNNILQIHKNNTLTECRKYFQYWVVVWYLIQ